MANEFKVKKGLIAYGSGAVVLDIQGSQGQLMSVTDTISSNLFSVKNSIGTEQFAVSSSGGIKMPNLTTANQSNVVTIDTSTGLLYYTASSAFGGSSGPVSYVGLITTGSSSANQAITGSMTMSGSIYLPTLVTSSTSISNVVMYGTNGELFTTASSALALVRTVNGQGPVNGNISTALTAITTGTSQSLYLSSSGAVTSSLANGLIWVIVNDAVAANNGDSYIYVSGAVGQWYPIAPLDQTAADARYLKLEGGTMTGNIVMGGKQITSASLVTVTGSLYITGSTYLQGIVTSSTTLTDVLMVSSSGQVFMTASSAIGGGGSSTLATSLTTNTTVGALYSGTSYAAGTPLETLLRTMLLTYYPPTFNGGLILRNGGSIVLDSYITYVEVNNAITINTASFSVGADSPNNRFPYSASFTASGATTGDFNYYFGNNVLSAGNNLGLGASRTVNRTTPGTIYFYVNGRRPDNNALITSLNCSAQYVYPVYYGMSAIDYSSTGDLSTDGNISQLLAPTPNNYVYYNNAATYAYYAYPASYGLLTQILDGNNFDITDAFNVYQRNQASTGWSGISYYIYKSPDLTTILAQYYSFRQV